MTVGSFLIIQDFMTGNEGAGSALFNGNPIYALCKSVVLSSKNTIGGKPKGFIDLTMDSDGDNLYTHWQRRKSYNQYISTEPLLFTADCTWADELGSVMIGLGSILTPYKLLRMHISGHQFFIRGTRAIENIMNGENELTGSFYNPTKGIPVVIEGISVPSDMTSTNIVNMSITFREDKE